MGGTRRGWGSDGCHAERPRHTASPHRRDGTRRPRGMGQRWASRDAATTHDVSASVGWHVGGRGGWGSGGRHAEGPRQTANGVSASARWDVAGAGGGAATGVTRSCLDTRRCLVRRTAAVAAGGAMGSWWARRVGQRWAARGAATMSRERTVTQTGNRPSQDGSAAAACGCMNSPNGREVWQSLQLKTYSIILLDRAIQVD